MRGISVTSRAGRQVVPVEHYNARAFKIYPDGREPYDIQDTLAQKLWFVVNEEFGPSAADVLAHKLQKAVEHHIKKTGQS